MIYGQLKNLDEEKASLSSILQKGLLYLKNTDLMSLSVGRHDIDGDHIFVLVSEYRPEPKKDRRPEAHQKYIDIQCLASGEEMIGCSFLATEYEITEDEQVKKDIVFYKEVRQEIDIVLEPGMYAIFFPNDVHRPCCISKSVEPVKKVVMKIAISLL